MALKQTNAVSWLGFFWIGAREMPIRQASEAMSDPATTEPLGLTHRPAMIAIGEELAPTAPTDLRATGMDSLVVSHLLLKTAYTVPQFTTEWAARRLHLPGTGNLRGLAPHNLPGIAIANRLQ